MKILLTLDYELCLNDFVGTVDECLIVPMQKFHQVCDLFGVRATIFVDAAYLYMLDKLHTQWPMLKEDYEKVKENIQWLEEQGYDIELHIHPQWYYSIYNETGWHLDWNHYKLSTAPYEESLVLFTESKNLLDSIIGRKTIAFRAGGYSIQQFNYQDCFKRNGIIADSSVFTNNKVLTETHYYNYVGAPANTYRFTDCITSPDSIGVFYEFPIGVGKFPFVQYMRKKRRIAQHSSQRWGNGGAEQNRSLYERIMKNIHRFKNGFALTKYPSASVDCDTYGLLEDIFVQNKENDILTIIGHPKNISASSMDYLKNFIYKRFNEHIEFTTLKSLALSK